MSHSSSSEDPDTPRFIRRLERHERGFWIAAIAWYGFGDTITTLYGLSYTAVAEIGPVAGPILDAHGTLGMLLLKVLFFVVAATAWYALNRPTRVAIPIGITIVGTAVTVWNVFVILLAQSA